jgi:hypothetical protein
MKKQRIKYLAGAAICGFACASFSLTQPAFALQSVVAKVAAENTNANPTPKPNLITATLGRAKAGDTVSVSPHNKTVTVKLVSTTGIGSVTLINKNKGGAWPAVVELLISYPEGKALRELEGFQLYAKRIRVEGSRRQTGKMSCFDLPQGKDKFASKPNRTVNVQVNKQPTVMKITIPGKLLKGESQIVIQWIDFYR